jgi:predicted  nucleic acid-binding Zn-ribbon protein
MNGERETVDQAFIGRALQRLMDDMRTVLDELTVLSGRVDRLDASHTKLLTEIRATHSQISRQGNRLRQLEDRVDALEDRLREQD